MAPKAKAATDQTPTTGKEAAKTTPLLQLPDLPLGPSTNGRHTATAAAQQQDDNAFDQDAADPLQAALGMLVCDEDGDDAEEMEDLLNLRSVLANVLKAKQDKTKKKQQAMLQELQEAAAKEVQAFEASMAKDHKQMMNSLTGATNAAKKKLTDKFHAIEDLNAKYQQDIKTAWDEYTAVYNKFDDTKRAASAQMEKLRSNHKRKLSELQASLQGRMGETQQKLAKLNSKAGKASGLDGMLKQFMG